MSMKHSPRSKDEWMSLITQCRQSGLSDSAWCEQNGIPSSSFYNAVSRLRKQACDIPEAVSSVPVMDLTARQDIVRINIVPDVLPAEPSRNEVPVMQVLPEHLDKSHMIEITFEDSHIGISNGADPHLLESLIRILRSTPC